MSCHSQCSSSSQGFGKTSVLIAMSNNPRAKTELCRSFTGQMHCKFGDHCKFAHGQHQLKSLPSRERPQRKKCHGYWDSNQCNYGVYCKFQHHKPDWVSKLILKMHTEAGLMGSRLLSALQIS